MKKPQLTRSYIRFRISRSAHLVWVVISLLLRGFFGTVIIILTVTITIAAYLLCLPVLLYGSLKALCDSNY